MQKTLEMKLTADEAEKISATIKEYDKAILHIFKKMDRDQVEIEKLRAETRQMLTQMKAQMKAA